MFNGFFIAANKTTKAINFIYIFKKTELISQMDLRNV